MYFEIPKQNTCTWLIKKLQARKQQIQHISQDIEYLSAQLNQLIIQNQLDEQEEQQDLQALEQELHIGDQVEITNNYKGLWGALGVTTLHLILCLSTSLGYTVVVIDVENAF